MTEYIFITCGGSGHRLYDIEKWYNVRGEDKKSQ